ncbi:MAG: putative Ig domain-containing protein [Candidatus Nitrotoga sp.]
MNDSNTLQFGTGIVLEDIAISYDSATQTVMLVLGSGDTLHIGNPAYQAPNLYGSQNKVAIQQIKFADGSVTSVDALIKQYGMVQNGTDAVDTLQGSDSESYVDILWGGAGNDVLNSGSGNDQLTGGTGDDTLAGGVGNDTYVYRLGDGNDLIIDSGKPAYIGATGRYLPGINVLQFGAGIDATMINPVFDNVTQTALLVLSDGSRIDLGVLSNLSIQTLLFADGSSVAINALFAEQRLEQVGTEGADTLNGTLLNDYLTGSGGDDLLSGNEGSDVLEGGAGNDTLQGGWGSDTYIYNLGNGSDTIVDATTNGIGWQGGDQNTLSLGAGITADMLTPRFDSASQAITLDMGNGDILHVGNVNNLTIQILQFADGTTQTMDQFLTLRGLAIDGTMGADVLVGSASRYSDHLSGGLGDDVLNGGIAGDDVLAGGQGNDLLVSNTNGFDTMLFNIGDGADVIINGWGGNVLQLGAGITRDLILPRLDGVTGEVRLDFGNGDSIVVGKYDMSQSSLTYQIGQINFADGTAIALSTLLFQKGLLVEGTSSDEVLQGAINNLSRMYGFDGNDTLTSGQLDDVLEGGTGSDSLAANYGNDLLTGGLGDDRMAGGEGNDVYVYNLGDGADSIIDTMARRQINTVRLGAGTDVQSVEYRGGKTGDLLFHFADGGSLRVAGVTADNVVATSSVQRFELADGTVLSAQELLSQFTIQVWGDAFQNGTNLDDQVRGDWWSPHVFLGGSGDDALEGGYYNDTLSGDGNNDSLYGFLGNDTLYGRENDDVLVGGEGNDMLLGGTGNDTYVFNLGDGEDRIIDNAGIDALRFGAGITQADLAFSKVGGDLRIALSNGRDVVVLENWFTGNTTVNTLLFDDSSTFDLAGIAQSVVDIPVIGTAAADTLVGSIYNDTLQGEQGNDTLIGGTGDDVYRFNIGDGVDQIYELSAMTGVEGSDTVEFGAGITVDMLWLDMQVVNAMGNNQPTDFPDPNADLMSKDDQRQLLNIQIGNQGDAIQVMSGKGAIEHFRFADGTIYTWKQLAAMQGTVSVTDNSNDQAWLTRQLDGLGMAADFNGSIGSDILLGGTHDDAYRFNLGDGQDVIADFGGTNKINFGTDVAVSDVWWSYDPTSMSPFMLNVGGNGDSIAVFGGEHGAIQQFNFVDGTVMSFDQLITAQGGIGLAAPVLVDQEIFTPYNIGQNNLVVGGDGADLIYVGSGTTNFIVGGKGNDTINANNWDNDENIVLINLGDGQDTLSIGSYSHAVTVLFGVDVNAASVNLAKFNHTARDEAQQDMFISYGDQGDTLFINGSIPGAGEGDGNNPAVRVKFADGTAWSYEDLLARTQNMVLANPNNPVLLGTTGSDIFVIGDQAATYTIVDVAGAGNSNTVELGWHYADAVLLLLADRIAMEDDFFSMGVSASKVFPFNLSLVGGSLSVRFDNGVTLNIDGFDPNDPLGSSAISQFKFADGTVLGIEQILAAGIEIIGTDAADVTSGTAVNDRIDGLSGDDSIIGGKGSDVLRGGTGNDTYVFNRGDGADTIEDISSYWVQQQLVVDSNVLNLGAGINPTDVVIKIDPSNGKVYLDMGSGDSLSIGESGNFSVQSVQFSDGTVWDEWMITSLIVVGTGAEPDASMFYSASLADGSMLPDWLIFDGAARIFSGVPTNSDVGALTVSVTAIDTNGHSVTSTFVLEVLNVNDAPTIVSPIIDQSVYAGQLFSFSAMDYTPPPANNFLVDETDAGTPDQVWTNYNNVLYGSGGDDTYTFVRGDGKVYISDWDNSPMDTVQFTDVSSADITVTQNQWGQVILSISGMPDSLNLGSWLYADEVKIEQINFADGVVWGVNDIQARLSMEPSTGNDYITGADSDVTILALSGDDRAFSGAGNDVVLGGAGNDNLSGGTGSDILSGGSGADVIEVDWSYTDTASDLLLGGAGDDEIWASASNDLLIGGTGADYIDSYDGYNVILFNLGDGSDFIDSGSSSLGAKSDTLSLGGGIHYDDLTFSRDGDNLILHTGTDELITFGSWFSANWNNPSMPGNYSVHTLQIITEAMVGYDTQSADPLLNQRVRQFDFVGLASQFEAALAADPTLTAWQLAPHLSSFSMGGSGTQAIGGDMAYLYGNNGNLDGLSEVELRAQLSDVQFGIGVQTLTKIGGNNAFADVDFIHGDRLTYTATLADGSPLPAWLGFDAATQTFSGAPDQSAVGNLQVSVIATDTGGLSVTNNFVLTVAGDVLINTAPLAAPDFANVSEDAAQTTIAITDLLANDLDPDTGDILSLVVFDAVTAQGNGVTQNFTGNLVLDIGNNYQVLGAGQVATDSFTYTVGDAAGATASTTVSVTIEGVNDAPVLVTPIAAQQTAEDTLFSFTLPAGTFTDIDNGDVSSYGATLPVWLTFDVTTQIFSGTPLNEHVGNLNILVTATDTGGLSVSSTFALNVMNVNDAPIATADINAVQEDLVLFANGNVLSNDSDADQGALLMVVNAGEIAGQYGSLTLSANGNYSYTLNNTLFAVQSLGREQSVLERFDYSVTDGLVSTPSILTITLAGNNDAPIIAVPLADQSVLVNTAYTWIMPAGSFSDVDQSDVLDYSASLVDGSPLLVWLTFNAATQTLSGTVPSDATGFMDIQIITQDKVAATGSMVGSLSTADVFRLTFNAGGKGNEGLGNGQDAPPPGHTINQNDGAETSPGNPGAQGQIPVKVINGTENDDTLTGSVGADKISGKAGNDTLAGGTGADTLIGGTRMDAFVFAAGDSVLTLGGTGNAGTIAGFDTITDFTLGVGGDTINTVDVSTVVADITVNGTNSTLTIAGQAVKSHRITSDMITFDDADTFASALSLTNMSDVAAVAQYLQANDLGNAGSTVAFTASIGGTAHTYLFTQGDNAGTNNLDVLVDMVGTTALGVSTTITADHILIV